MPNKKSPTKKARVSTPKIHKHKGKYITGSFLVLVIVFGAFTILGNLALSKKTVVSSVATPENRVLGDSSNSEEYKLTINRLIKSIDNSPEGTYRVTINVTITNTSDSTIEISPLIQMHLSDKASNLYNMTAEYSKNKILGGPLAPGREFTENIDFNLPNQAEAKSFVSQLDSNSKMQAISID